MGLDVGDKKYRGAIKTSSGDIGIWSEYENKEGGCKAIVLAKIVVQGDVWDHENCMSGGCSNMPRANMAGRGS
jgi:hypothetical protein